MLAAETPMDTISTDETVVTDPNEIPAGRTPRARRKSVVFLSALAIAAGVTLGYAVWPRRGE